MAMKSELDSILEDALDDSVQEIFNLWRETTGDNKMHNPPWRSDPRRVLFLAWLQAVSAFASRAQ